MHKTNSLLIKSIPWMSILFLMMILTQPAQAANGCSASLGKASLNEYNYIDNFTEVKKLDTSISMSGWKVTIYTSNKTTSGSLPTSGANNCYGGVYQVNQFAANEISQNADVVLFDSNNDIVDIVRVRTASNYPVTATYYLPTIPACNFLSPPYDLLVSAANKGVDRYPDGNGYWRNTPGAGSNSYQSRCGPNTPPPATSGTLDAVEVGAAAGTPIHTKVAAKGFSLDLLALDSSGALMTTYNKTVTIELVDASSSTTCSSMTQLQNVGTYTFTGSGTGNDNGRKTYPFNYANAANNVRVRMTDNSSPAVISCSTDNFAIRPDSFINTSASDNDWATAGTTRTLYNTAATGGNVHKAGQPFSMSATAVNALNATTTNYTGTPSAILSACLQPTSGCMLGTFSAGTWVNTAGVLTTNTASYNDAGAFTMQLSDANFASVDAADSTAAERTITSTSFNVGRFVPDHFDLAASNIPLFRTFDTTDGSCNSAASAPKRRFTYIGQAFGYVTAPQATLTARNSIGSTTTNYQGTLWHNPTSTASYSSTNTLDTTLTSAPIVTSNNNGTGVVAITSTDKLAHTRNITTPQNPFNAAISLSMNATDSSESVVTGNGTINTSSPLIFNGTGSGIAFDAGNLFRYGRLMLSNANGTETLDLPIPMATQYWNGSNFVSNTDDNCTALAGLNITLKNYTKNLAACETAISISGPFNAGKSNLKLLKPGVGNNGSVDLLVNLGATATGQTCTPTATTSTAAAQSYLQGKWSGATYDKNPTARATFGIYKNANEFIYMREMY